MPLRLLEPACPSAVLDNVQHRSTGTAGVDTRTNANSERAKVIGYMESVDAATLPINS